MFILLFMQSDQKVPRSCTHPSVSNDDLQLAAAMERSGPFVLLYFVIFLWKVSA